VLSEAKLTLSVEYRSRAQLPPESDAWWFGVLGMAQFGLNLSPLDLAQVPVAAVPLSPCGDADALYEIWRADGPMQIGNCEDVQYRFNEQLLFGCIALPESSQETTADSALKTATTAAYAQIFASLETTGYRQLLRVWNYVSGINQAAEAGERYWLFNKARYESFVAFDRPVSEVVPAASAVGTPRESPLVVYFLASRTVAQMLENPRQVSAYRYPVQYGPRSPTFSRAALLAEGDGTLMISGTASIVGHETAHSENACAQTTESLANISALIDAANRRLFTQHFALETLTYKVYVRNAADLPAIAEAMRRAIGRKASVAYMYADICRRDLLVEIEAAGSGQSLTGAARDG
jgi:chorismate lyase / 3-hydroxybenzoate synthase